jgi:hypothetical protein
MLMMPVTRSSLFSKEKVRGLPVINGPTLIIAKGVGVEVGIAAVNLNTSRVGATTINYTDSVSDGSDSGETKPELICGSDIIGFYDVQGSGQRRSVSA